MAGESKTGDDGFAVPELPGRLVSANTGKVPPLPYEAPADAGVPQQAVNLEVVKDGSVVEAHTVPTDKSFFTFGRLPICDFPMEHESVSRYHAVLQFYSSGSMRIIDLGSSHGTFVNKRQLAPRTPQDVSGGDQIRFGMSSRVWIVGSSEPDNEDDTDTQPKPIKQIPRPDQQRPYNSDPVEYLRKFLDERGYEFEPEEGTRNADGERLVSVRVTLPFVDEDDERMLAGVGLSPTKAEAERLACLDALEKLDKLGYLNSSAKAADKGREDSGSDDEYYDRTCTKTTASGHLVIGEVESESSLQRKIALVAADIAKAKEELARIPEAAAGSTGNDDDELDAYMSTLAHDDQEAKRKRAQIKVDELERHMVKVQSLLDVVAPGSKAKLHPLPPPSQPRPLQPEQPQAQQPQAQQPRPHRTEPSVAKEPKEPEEPSAPKPQDARPQEKRRRVHGPTRQEMEQHTANNDNDDNSSWQPPPGQSGDGRTSLNEKLGY